MIERLRALLAADGPHLRVDPASAPAVAAALTDLRLVIGERLGIRSEADADAVYRLVVEGGPLDVAELLRRAHAARERELPLAWGRDRGLVRHAIVISTRLRGCRTAPRASHGSAGVAWSGGVTTSAHVSRRRRSAQ